MAVRAGADVITHVPRDGVIDPETVAHLAAGGQVAVPTLTQMAAVARTREDPMRCDARDSNIMVLVLIPVP